MMAGHTGGALGSLLAVAWGIICDAGMEPGSAACKSSTYPLYSPTPLVLLQNTVNVLEGSFYHYL